MIHVVIVAAGSGTRFGGDVPKQFQNLDGRPVVMRTIEAFRRALPGAAIKLVLSESMAGYWDDLTRRYGFDSPEIVFGGATRFDSVKNAIKAIETGGIADDDIVLVHDGARPLVSNRVIGNVIDGVRARGAVVPVVPLTDSIREITGPDESRPVDRSVYRAVQTPQGFRARLIADAYHREADPTFTDDASVAEAAGIEVGLVEGDHRNIKITNRGDLDIARVLMALNNETEQR